MAASAGSGRQLRFNVLGPLECWSHGKRVAVGGLLQKRILTTLLLNPDRVLPIPRLVDAAWVEEPPATAAHQVRKAVADLRRRIPGGDAVLVTDGPGYRAELLAGESDLGDFGALRTAARAAAGADRLREAAVLQRRALDLWRGPMLPELAESQVIAAAVTALEEQRLACAEQLYETCLGLGEAAEIVADLRALVDANPLRESLRTQLMLALYRSGRQAEALDEFGRARDILVEELGIEPGPQLARIHEDILRTSPGLDLPPPPEAPRATPPAPSRDASASQPPAPAPCTLPSDLADFTGRDHELAVLLKAAGNFGHVRTPQGSHSRILAVDGMGGSGKTSLAVHAAHLLADAYPDGQLYIDLRGHSSAQALSVPEALDSLLRTLGVPGDRIPEHLAARAALWQAVTAGRTMLLLLDNAADTAVVRALLPNHPGCLVLATSRARLVDLDSAQWLSLREMPAGECADLLRELLGDARIDAEPEAARELSELCGRLPLALRIASARLRNRPRWTLEYLVGRLSDETNRLDELSSGERSVAATLRLSYQALSGPGREALRLLAVHPGGHIDAWAAGALLDVSPRESEGVLESLLDAHLLQQPDIGLYGFHDLVRSFAQSLSSPAAEHTAAGRRLVDHYLHATDAACQVMFPGRRTLPSGLAAPATPLLRFTDSAAAADWFARQQETLRAGVALSDQLLLDRHTVLLVRNLAFQLSARGHLEEFRRLGMTAVAAARRLGDPALLAVSLSNLGVACWKLGHLAEGITIAEESREIAERLGDRLTMAHSDSTLGQLKSLLGRFAEALVHLERSIACERDLGDRRAEAESLTLLSTLYEQWGRYAEAADAARLAIERCAELGRHENELMARTDLALALLGLRDLDAAEDHLVHARALCEDLRDHGHMALVFAASAAVAHLRADTGRAREFAERAMELVRDNGSQLRRSKVQNMVGRYWLLAGEPERALGLHTCAEEAARSLEFRVEQAYALAGMADALRGLGRGADAERREAAAEDIFTELDLPPGRRRF